jgi:hypothetical protein
MSSPSIFKIKIKNSNKPYSSVLMLCIYIQEKANVIEQQQNSLPREFCVWHHLKSQRMNLYSAFIETCFISLTFDCCDSVYTEAIHPIRTFDILFVGLFPRKLPLLCWFCIGYRRASRRIIYVHGRAEMAFRYERAIQNGQDLNVRIFWAK